MVFAAGLGTRLRPLTDAVPKPLAPVGPWPLLRYAVETMKAASITEIVVNLHHLPDAIPAAVGDGTAWGVRITWSREPVLLGTGGGLRNVRAFFGDEPFAVLNGDTIVDVDLRAAIQAHRDGGAVATMVLKEDPRVDQFGSIGFDGSGRVWDFVGRVGVPSGVGPLRKALFTGVQIFSPKVFDYIAAAGVAHLGTETYPAILADRGKVSSVLQQGTWSDLGTVDRLFEANLDLLVRRATFSQFDPLRGFAEGPRGVFVGTGASFGPGTTIRRPALVGRGATIEAGATVGPYAVVGAGSVVERGATLSRCLVLEKASVAGEVRDVIVGERTLCPIAS